MKPGKKKNYNSHMGVISPERLQEIRSPNFHKTVQTVSLEEIKERKPKKASSVIPGKKASVPKTYISSKQGKIIIEVKKYNNKESSSNDEAEVNDIYVQIALNTSNSAESNDIQYTSIVESSNPVWEKDNQIYFNAVDFSGSLTFSLMEVNGNQKDICLANSQLTLSSLFNPPDKSHQFSDWLTLSPKGAIEMTINWIPEVAQNGHNTGSLISSRSAPNLTAEPGDVVITEMKMVGKKKQIGTISKATSLEEYMAQLAINDPQVSGQNGKDKKVKSIHELVSLKKRRYKDKNFDLDLAYITDRIIAMGFPSEGVEGLYRNPMSHTQLFLNSNHKNSYKVYNLCSERSYAPKKFYRYESVPFDDHCPPTLGQFEKMCRDMDEWLDCGEDNVVAIHCKAGKGRTGTMICAFLVWRYADKFSPKLAMDFYGDRRTLDRKGVTIPSQRRFIRYFCSVIEEMRNGTFVPDDCPRNILSIVLQNPPSVFAPNFTITSEEKTYEYKDHGPVGKYKDVQTITLEIKPGPLKINQETKIEFWDESTKEKKPVFRFWFHSKFLLTDAFVLPLRKLDKVRGKERFSQDFTVTVNFQEIESPKNKMPSKKKNISSKSSKQQLVDLFSQNESSQPVKKYHSEKGTKSEGGWKIIKKNRDLEERSISSHRTRGNKTHNLTPHIEEKHTEETSEAADAHSDSDSQSRSQSSSESEK